ncbi:DUF1697 domain-containing protein [Zhihengliuella flava]|uniref:Uncharacterized protein (DUF1697 family) n=1 Tax=Zhihengliuella flava TaxID=1285193 RepID=A0A931GF67_9MICC|nr:DUF1697 domain-containing protein [Zhihengliuella flava]MBG6084332.1 uncharacterized protein (DUF1697 family) [Zhihengliuella flava]
MTEFVAFLRGINVGGRRPAMADLADCVRAAGMTDVHTILATGNIRFASDEPGEAVATRLEAAISERFGFAARLFVKTLPELAAVREACPFGPTEVHDGVAHHTYVTFTADAQTVAEILGQVPAGQRLAEHGDVLFWQTPKGSSLDHPVAKVMNRARIKERTTTRNVNTLDKILAR